DRFAEGIREIEEQAAAEALADGRLPAMVYGIGIVRDQDDASELLVGAQTRRERLLFDPTREIAGGILLKVGSCGRRVHEGAGQDSAGHKRYRQPNRLAGTVIAV